MSQKAQHTIQKKVNEFSIPPHDSDWNDIENKLNTINRKKRKRLFIYLTAAAVAILFITAGGLFFHKKTDSTHAPQQVSLSTINKKNSNQTINQPNNKTEDNTNTLDLSDIAVSQKCNPTQKSSLSVTTINKRDSDTYDNNKNEKLLSNNNSNNTTFTKDNIDTISGNNSTQISDTIKHSNNINKANNKQYNDNDRDFKPLTPKTLDKNTSVSVLFTSNSKGYNEMRETIPPFGVVTPNPEKVYDKTSHNLPLSFGFSVRKGINKRFAIETGLIYTYLRSNFNMPEVEKIQKLHYLGIPLAGIINIKQFGRFSIYASAGGMVEKNISGKHIIKAKRKDAIDIDVKTNKLQWSVNTNIGVDYRFFNRFSLYFQPGWTYYFDDNSGLATYRSVHKSSISLQAGLRYNF